MTLAQMICQSYEKWKPRRCMMVKSGGAYKEIGWDEFYTMVLKTAMALFQSGIEPGDRVAIVSHTRMEWAVADSGALTAGAITVPIYPSLEAHEIKELLIRSGSKIVFVSDGDLVEKIKSLGSDVGVVRKIIVFEKDALPKGAALPFEALYDVLARTQIDHGVIENLLASRTGDDVATIIYTSGTTGEPKGVMLTHQNILSNVLETLRHFEFGENDIHLAHLPLAHIFERMGGYYLMLYTGATIGYAENIQTVSADIAMVRPTVLVTVPRIFEKIYSGIQAKAAEAGGALKAITLWAMGIASSAGIYLDRKEPLPFGLALKFKIADKLVLSKIRAKVGGRLRFCVSGGAPLAPELGYFFLGVGLPIMEGYGLTETSPVIAANTFENYKVGTVGKPLDNLEVKIAEDGEILVRGPSVFIGYHQNPSATAEALSPEGWFATGDIGIINGDGFLKITDRKKDLIVTAGGKNIAPQKIENILKMDKFICEAMLYGDKKNFLTALIIPDFEWLKKYAEHKGIPYEDRKAMVADERVVDLYRRRIEALQKEHHLANYEMVKKFIILDHEFSTTEGEVTPTLKLKRKAVTSHYKDLLEGLYEK